MKDHIRFKANLLLGAAAFALLVESAETISMTKRGSPLAPSLTWQTASIAGPWAPHGADRDYPATSVYGNALMTVSGTLSNGSIAISST